MEGGGQGELPGGGRDRRGAGEGTTQGRGRGKVGRGDKLEGGEGRREGRSRGERERGQRGGEDSWGREGAGREKGERPGRGAGRAGVGRGGEGAAGEGAGLRPGAESPGRGGAPRARPGESGSCPYPGGRPAQDPSRATVEARGGAGGLLRILPGRDLTPRGSPAQLGFRPLPRGPGSGRPEGRLRVLPERGVRKRETRAPRPLGTWCRFPLLRALEVVGPCASGRLRRRASVRGARRASCRGAGCVGAQPCNTFARNGKRPCVFIRVSSKVFFFLLEQKERSRNTKTSQVLIQT